jgi:hypothetical protein
MVRERKKGKNKRIEKHKEKGGKGGMYHGETTCLFTLLATESFMPVEKKKRKKNY